MLIVIFIARKDYLRNVKINIKLKENSESGHFLRLILYIFVQFISFTDFFNLWTVFKFPVPPHFSRRISFRFYPSFFPFSRYPYLLPFLPYKPYPTANPIDIIFLSDLVIRQDYSTVDYISVFSFEAALFNL